MRFFLAGIIQGSKARGIHAQDYRRRIKAALQEAFPHDEVFCPIEHHPNSVRYGQSIAQSTFFQLMSAAAQADAVVAYLPEASMGTAIETWEAYRAGKRIVCISPLRKNWVVQFLSHQVYDSLEDFEAAAADGRLARLFSPPTDKAESARC